MFSVGDPSRTWETVTPSDTVNLVGESSYIYVGVTGDVSCQVTDAVTGLTSTKLFKACAVGYHPIRTTRINSTNTTATTMLAAH